MTMMKEVLVCLSGVVSGEHERKIKKKKMCSLIQINLFLLQEGVEWGNYS